ncbi:molybdate ABC transporter substrate-binding protein [Thermomicrobium sp. 4228-Ro]|uniref:molybdate ABC transporter substrate-binding protein n=1 Tax=Thermomicrobium sp. 4228-Ro TaxID=2993937 RepID=UPI002248FECE|nr:molybdate ABC transporter substrate-binding protein [Thermomicrobium sp. 4228-Ro]MCX2728226.1 molybdate ABC transporter substrate-binding protein [Thermomicrobium sp. 4228-Ro]
MSRGSQLRGLRGILLLSAVLLVLASCSSSTSSPAREGAGASSSESTPAHEVRDGSAPGSKLVVFAASSLLEPFQEIGQEFQRQTGTTVEFNFAGSAQLVAQLQQGALADVIALADLQNMHKAQDLGLVRGAPVLFARNRLVIVVPKENPAGIEQVADLARPGVKVVLAHENVPVGKYAREMLARASQQPGYGADFSERVLGNVVSQEVNVKQVLAKVALGEADAGIVYATDVKAAASEVRTVTIPDELNVVACYPIAIGAGSRVPEQAARFVDFVRSEAGRAVLERSGFLPVASGQDGTEGCS